MSEALLGVDTVGDYLVRRGLLTAAKGARAVALGGGVSNVVLRVTAPDFDVVVKQSLPRLNVPDEWLAPRERSLTEAHALELAARIAPGSAPALIDIDPEALALTIAAAPDGWRDWKADLLRGEVDASVGERLGRLLATWQSVPVDAAVLATFDVPEAFERLRLDPYHRTVAARRPELASAVLEVVRRTAAQRRCLVHGDFSPKNVLVGDGSLWLIDFEVAHVGDPSFDPAFLMTHLLLKAIHRPSASLALRQTAAAFWSGYGPNVTAGLPATADKIGEQTGCLLLARAVGKSPAEYLDAGGRDVAERLGTALLHDPPPEPITAFEVLSDMARH